MSVAEELRELSHKFENEADPMLEKVQDDPELFSLMVKVVATVTSFLERSASAVEKHISQTESIETEGVPLTAERLSDLVKIAEAFDNSGDPELVKVADLLDELLLTVAAPRNVVAQSMARSESEIERLREKYRGEHRDNLYKERRKELDDQNKKADIQKAVKEQVKQYRPLQAPLQTRYCPDHPGVGMSRIADRVYQCALDHKVYNWETGFTTENGSKIPGGGVEKQTPDWGQMDSGHTVFDTRQNMMSRYASAEPEDVKTDGE